MNLLFIFLTGLTTGGISCMAVQGGLLASVIANQRSSSQITNIRTISFFVVAKFIAHVVLGVLLGWLGSFVTLSLGVRLIFQSLAALFMLATAANLLQLHPIFRYLAFQPPKFLQRLIRNESKQADIFAPVVLGFLTIFVPCGITQAMEVLAISTGSPLQGALIMGVFTAGTMPLFAGFGYLAQTLKSAWQSRFSQVAAVALIFMGVWSLNGVLLVLNAPITIQKIVRPVAWFFSNERFTTVGSGVPVVAGVQKVTIEVTNQGYSPNKLIVRSGQPVALTLQSHETYSCALSFVLREFGIAVELNPTDQRTVSFTPTRKGAYTFSCSMGMYSGTLEVI